MTTEKKVVRPGIYFLIAGSSGNVLEWYDFTVYGFLATIIGTQFFPNEDKTIQLISTFGIFAAGYLMRPLGGVVFGYIGDKYGRKKALLYSVLLMAIPTTLMAFLPTYESIGWYAALLLVVLRLLQGLSVGGEFTNSMSFLAEKAPEGRRGFFSSFSTFGVFGGMLMGSGVASLVSSLLNVGQMHEFGWRIPFLFGAVIGIVGLLLRRGMGEEKHFVDINEHFESKKSPLSEFWSDHKFVGLKIVILSWALGVSVYLLFIFLPSFLHTFHNVKLDEALSSHTIAIVLLMLMIPYFGYLNDKIGRKRVLFISLSGFVLLSYPLFSLMFFNSFRAILTAMLIFAVLQAMFQSVMPALMSEMLPTRVRCTGLSVSYNVSMALFGGTTPLVCTWLVKVSGGNVWMPAYYLIFVSIIAIITLFFIPETYKNALD